MPASSTVVCEGARRTVLVLSLSGGCVAAVPGDEDATPPGADLAPGLFNDGEAGDRDTDTRCAGLSLAAGVPAVLALGGGPPRAVQDRLRGSLDEPVDVSELVLDGVHTLAFCPGVHAVALEVRGEVELALVGLGPPGGVILDGQGQATPVAVSEAARVALRDLVLTGGLGVLGGALTCEGAVLSLSEVALLDSEARYGGGLRASGCELALEGVRIEGNTATGYGGGLYLGEGSLVASRLEVRGNSGASGGGMSLHTSTASLAEASFSQNTGSSTSGLRLTGSEVELEEVWFDQHDAGGERVIFAHYSTLAWRGGGLTWSETGSDAAVGLRGTELRGEDLELTGNASREGTAAGLTLMSEATAELVDCEVSANLSMGATSLAWISSGHLQLEGGRVAGNYTPEGAALGLWGGYSSLSVMGTDFAGNDDGDVLLATGEILLLGTDAETSCTPARCTAARSSWRSN